MHTAIVDGSPDETIREVLSSIDLDDDRKIRDASSQATPSQVFEVVLPFVFSRRQQVRRRTYEDGSIRWTLSGPGGGEWTLSFVDGALEVVTAEPGSEATVSIAMTVDTWRALRTGQIQPHAAMIAGKLKVRGNMSFILNHPYAIP